MNEDASTPDGQLFPSQHTSNDLLFSLQPENFRTVSAL